MPHQLGIFCEVDIFSNFLLSFFSVLALSFFFGGGGRRVFFCFSLISLILFILKAYFPLFWYWCLCFISDTIYNLDKCCLILVVIVDLNGGLPPLYRRMSPVPGGGSGAARPPSSTRGTSPVARGQQQLGQQQLGQQLGQPLLINSSLDQQVGIHLSSL